MGNYRTLSSGFYRFSLLLIADSLKSLKDYSKEIMRTRRQPPEQFRRRLKEYSEPAVKPFSRIRKYKESDAWLWTEVAAVVVGLAFVIPTAIALWIDLGDRQTQRVAQAWELVTRVAPGNAGKGPALEYLSSQKIPLVGIDLSAENNLSSSYLVMVNLSGANLNGANLLRANLNDANLSGTNLNDADLSGANLFDANLSGANLEYADLSGADLTGANLSGADLTGANLSEANLFGANLSGANLIDTDLSGAVLFIANFSGAYLFGANFSGADLTDTNFSGAYLSITDLSGADLSSVDLWEIYLSITDLSEADFTGGDQKKIISLFTYPKTNAQNLLQVQLNDACGNEETKLPEGLNLKACID